MNDETYARVWSWAALTQCGLIGTMFLRTTAGGKLKELVAGIEVSGTTVPALGLPVDLLAALSVLGLTGVWALRQRDLSRWHRVPPFHFTQTEVPVATRDGKLYRGMTFLVVHVLTLIAIAQMGVRYFSSGVFQQTGKEVVPGGWSHFDYSTVAAAGAKVMLTFGSPDGPQHFAVLPWIYASFGVCYLTFWVVVAWLVLRAPASARVQAKP